MKHDCLRETVQAHGKRKYRRQSGSLCPCGDEQRVPGQGYGPKCRAKAQAKYREKVRRELEFYRKFFAERRGSVELQGRIIELTGQST